jgi:FMN phosphatase YigB (HAD superfamily)/predicted kinase
LASSILGSVYLDKDDINLELGKEFDASSDYYKKVIAPLTYRVMIWRAKAALAQNKIVICDGYFGNKLTVSPIVEQLQSNDFSAKIIYFHCSGEKQEERLKQRGLERDQDKEGVLFAPYRKQHLQDHVKELSQVPHLVIDTESNSDLSKNVKTILHYLESVPNQNYCYISKVCPLSNEESMFGANTFMNILDRHQKELLAQKYEQEKSGISIAKEITQKKPIKKVIILDAGGVLQPDAELDLPNQVALSKLTKLTLTELNAFNKFYRDHDVLTGKRSFTEVLSEVANNAKASHKLSIDELLQAYKKGVTLFPGVPEMIRELYKAGYQVVICTTNSDLGVEHTKWLLAEQGLHCPVYGSAELHLHKHNPRIYLKICEKEKVSPDECWFIDDRERNLDAARSLGISGIKFNPPSEWNHAAKEVNACREQLLALGILRADNFVFPKNVKRGKYPSLFGIVDNKVSLYQPSNHSYVAVDEPNEDGNQRKRCLYQSRLAKLIVEEGRQYWCRGYHAINKLFLADFDLKSDPKRVNNYKNYFDKIWLSLKKEKLIEDKAAYDIAELRKVLTELFVVGFNLTNVSQFYYNVWLFDYGPEPLEPFVFLTELLKQNYRLLSENTQSIRLLKLFPDMDHDAQERREAYLVAQPWVTCGVPQLRGRKLRTDAPNSTLAQTSGITRDDDPDAIPSPPHFAAKNFFSPSREHPIAKEFQANAAPIVGGSSGTLGRNILMLAPLVKAGLLSQLKLKTYVMGFSADLINRGHHSYEEVVKVGEEVIFSRKPWLDSLRDPKGFYEQLLTDEFLASPQYCQFATNHKDFFHEPIARIKMN